jgi:opacity protein-like surface antigen
MKRTALVGLLALVSWSVQAAQNVPGWSAGAAASFVDFQGDDEINPPVGDKFIDDSSVGAKIWGQYRFNERFGIEAAYHNTGELEDLSTSDAVEGTLEISFDGFSIQGMIFFPLANEEIQPYLKGGYYDFDDELSVNGNVTSNSSESSWVFGGGAIIDISDNFAIRADADWFDAEVGDLWAVNLGLQYSFGGSPSAVAADPAADGPADEGPAAESPAASDGETTE